MDTTIKVAKELGTIVSEIPAASFASGNLPYVGQDPVLVGTILSLYHLGIEHGFIQESLVCDLKSGSDLLSKEEILKQLQKKNVSCKDVTFKIFGLSLTTINILLSLLIIILLIH